MTKYTVKPCCGIPSQGIETNHTWIAFPEGWEQQHTIPESRELIQAIMNLLDYYAAIDELETFATFIEADTTITKRGDVAVRSTTNGQCGQCGKTSTEQLKTS